MTYFSKESYFDERTNVHSGKALNACLRLEKSICMTPFLHRFCLTNFLHENDPFIFDKSHDCNQTKKLQKLTKNLLLHYKAFS